MRDEIRYDDEDKWGEQILPYSFHNQVFLFQGVQDRVCNSPECAQKQSYLMRFRTRRQTQANRPTSVPVVSNITAPGSGTSLTVRRMLSYAALSPPSVTTKYLPTAPVLPPGPVLKDADLS